jgi:hypothetical protein
MKTAKILAIILGLLSLIIVHSCKKDKPPTIITNAVTEVSFTSATSGGNVTDEGGSPIVSRGICWNTSPGPTIENNKTTETGGVGTFTCIITQLTPNTIYYARAFATNSIGPGYGNQVSFTTSKKEIKEIRIEPSNASVKEFETIQLAANVFYNDGSLAADKNVTWQSKDTLIARIDSKGLLSGMKSGTVTIVASCLLVSNQIVVTVVDNPVKTIEIQSLPDSICISHKFQIKALIKVQSGLTIDNPKLITWTSSNKDILEISNTGEIFARAKGVVNINLSFRNYSFNFNLKVTSIEITAIDTYLSVLANNYIKKMPVIVVRFLPTKNGIDLAVSQSPDYWSLGEITLEKLKNNIDVFDKRIKYSLEEGSRYRGYKDNQAVPYLGYEIVKYITVYEQIPASNYNIGNDQGTFLYEPDFHAIFNRFGLSAIINSNSVKEVWLWMGEPAHASWPSYNASTHGLIPKHVAVVESNMASPTTENISNSWRIKGDMPILNQTYVVYCYNFRRTQAEAVHNHGHQLESILKYANEKQDLNLSLFLQNFCGWGDNNYTQPPLGRAGDCHHPPNTKIDYDYLNTTLVESDIEDWKPGGGTKKQVNVDTWGKLTYNWPGASDFNQRVESQWYIYWMQNMPGYNNNILYSIGKKITNWWIFTADWDGSIISKKGLHE